MNAIPKHLVDASKRYELLLKISSGGMGTVYLGRLKGTEGFSRLVAVKRAHPHLLEDSSARQMILEEAKITSYIRNPHVISVQDVEEAEGELLLIMEYVEGGPLSSLLGDATPSLPAPVAIRILLDVCAGLHAAHTQTDSRNRPLGIVHRDISPHNVLIGARDGMASLTDFGIAKVAHPTSHFTQTGAVRGKAAYVAPEYAEGQTADARSDQFSLAIVGWESLARQKLFAGANDMDILRRICSEVPPFLSMIDEQLEPFDAVFSKALAKRPEDRFASVLEFSIALEKVARAQSLVARHHEVAEHVSVVLRGPLEERRNAIADLEKKLSLHQKAAAPASVSTKTANVLGDSEKGSSVKTQTAEVVTQRRPSSSDQNDSTTRQSAAYLPDEPATERSPGSDPEESISVEASSSAREGVVAVSQANIPTGRMSSIPPVAHASPRSRTVWLLGALAVVALGAAVAVLSMGGQTKRELPQVTTVPTPAASASNPSPVSEPDPTATAQAESSPRPEDSAAPASPSTRPALTRPGLSRPARQNSAGASSAKKLPANPY